MRERCNEPVRGSATPCKLDAGHPGYHSAAVFGCDGCGKVVRLHRLDTRVPEDDEGGFLMFCFVCAEDGRAYLRRHR